MPSRGPPAANREVDAAPPSAPDWHRVEQLLARLADTRAFFPTATSQSNWISSYEPGKRLRLEADAGSKWVQLEHLKECWEKFERLGHIRRVDVLEPGRCSAFVMALFARVPGVREEGTDERSLRLDRADVPSAR